MFRLRALPFALLTFVTTLTGLARADEPSESTAPPAVPEAASSPSAPSPSAPLAAEPIIVPPPTIPTPAWPACGEDQLVRRDGGMLRGVIVELLPRERIVMRVATGELLSVPWAEVHHVQQGGPVARSCTPSEIPAASPVDDGGTATLVIEEAGYTLEGQYGTAWQVVCQSPCERVVARSRFHRVTGPGIQTSPGFRVNAQPGERVVLNVNPGHIATLGLGIGMLTVGVVAAYVGYAALPVQAIDNDTKWPLPTMIVGLAMTLGGGAIVQANLKTSVDQQQARGIPERERRGIEPPRSNAFLVPILSGRF